MFWQRVMCKAPVIPTEACVLGNGHIKEGGAEATVNPDAQCGVGRQ